MDGSERLQLTFPPLIVAQPRWSPDGTRIAFMGQETGKQWSIYVIPIEGGRPEQPIPGNHPGADPTWSPDGRSLLFGPGDRAGATGQQGLEIFNLWTHAFSYVPRSQGLWSPRWSRDGRFILAFPQAWDRLMLFDVRTQNWTELARVHEIGWPEWSHDSKHVYFSARPLRSQPVSVFRIRIGDRKLEQVASLKDLRQPMGSLGDWIGLAPDDSPLLLRDIGSQDIYALDLDLP